MRYSRPKASGGRGGGRREGGFGGAGLRALPPVRRNGVELLEHLADTLQCSRRAAKSLLDDRLVWVNGRRIWMARHLLQTRDVVELSPGAAEAIAPAVQHGAGKGAAAAHPPIRLLLEDALFLVANKPPRLLTNGAKSLETRLKEQLGLPGLRAVHRLDKDTTGCVLFAKTEEARRALIAEFEEGRIRKLYHALVAGVMSEPTVDIRERIEGQTAVSHVRQVSVRMKPPRCAHVTVGIETGRTHQIRIHLQQAGHPVLGDRQYFSARSPDFQAVPRQMLHAAELRFEHPVTHQPLRAQAPLPADFRLWMKRLELD